MHGIRRFSLAATLIAVLASLCPPSSFAANEAIVSSIEARDAGSRPV